MQRVICLILTFVLFVATCGCVTDGYKEDYNVVTSFYPVMLLTKMVTENIDGINVTNLASPDTGCLHDYTLLPDDLKNLQKADAFIINGFGMEGYIEKLYEQQPDLKTIDLSKGIDAYNDNAHIWLSPKNAQKMIATLCYELVTALPEYSDALNSNTKKYTNMLIELDDEMKSASSVFNNVGVITCHEAFDYFAAEYNIRIDGTIQREPGEEPTTKELVETTNLIKSLNIKILLAEPQYSTTAADTLARETGATVYELDPLVTGHNTDTPTVYFEKMKNNLKILIEAIRKE